jgi:hypothetical protein
MYHIAILVSFLMSKVICINFHKERVRNGLLNIYNQVFISKIFIFLSPSFFYIFLTSLLEQIKMKFYII